MNKKTLLSIIFLGFGVAVFWLVIREQSWGEVWDIMRRADWKWLIYSKLTTLSAHALRTLRWQQLVETGGQKMRFLSAYAAILSSYMTNLAIPKSGEVYRCIAIQKTEGIPSDILLGTVVIERIIDVFLLLLILLFTFFLQRPLVENALKAWVLEPIIGSIYSPLSLLLMVSFFSVLLIGGLYLFSKGKTGRLLKGKISGFIAGLNSIKKVKSISLFTLFTVMMWGFYILGVVCDLKCLDSTEGIGWKGAMFVFIMNGISMAAPLQGGLGAYHFMVSRALLMLGIGLTEGIAYATLTHTAFVISTLATGGIGFLIIPFLAPSVSRQKQQEKIKFP